MTPREHPDGTDSAEDLHSDDKKTDEINGLDDLDLNDLDEDTDDDVDSTPRWVKPVTIIAVILIIVMVVVGIMFTVKGKSKKLVQTTNSSTSSIGRADNSTNQNVTDVSTFMDSIGVPKYYQQDKDKISKEDKATADKMAMDTRPTSSYGALASKESNPNLTDDVSKYKNADGTINQDYSYLTAENTIPLIRDDLERLVNPVYGGWTALQDPARADVNAMARSDSWTSLADMFTPAVAGGMIDESTFKNSAALFADWNRDYYGGSFKKMYYDPIVGSPSGLTCDYQLAGAEEDHIDCTANVKYTGKVLVPDEDAKNRDRDQDKEETKSVDKVIKLHYVVNYHDTAYSNRRLLLTSVEQ